MGASAAAEPPRDGVLEGRFWSRVETLTRHAGLGIASDCETELREFIANGVARIQREGQIKYRQRIDDAEENLTQFVERMIVEARQRGVGELHEYTFGAAIASLCPMWPFC